MKTTRISMFFIATTILLAHAIIPHTHHHESSDCPQLTSDIHSENLLDILALAFHNNGEQGQMDNYVPGNSLDHQIEILSPDMLLPEPIFNPEFTSILNETKVFTSDQVFTENIHLKSSLFRGPPAIC